VSGPRFSSSFRRAASEAVDLDLHLVFEVDEVELRLAG